MGRDIDTPVSEEVPVQTTVTKTVDKARVTFFELDVRPNRPAQGRVHFAIGFNEADGTFVRTNGGRIELDQSVISGILKTAITTSGSVFSNIIEDVLLDHLQSVGMIPVLKGRATPR